MADSEKSEPVKFIYTTYLNKPINEIKEILSQAIDFLNGLDHISKVFEDQNGFNAFCFITYSLAYQTKLACEILDTKHCADLFTKCFVYFNTIQNDLNFANVKNILHAEQLTDLNEKKAKLFCMLFYSINIYNGGSMDFCLNFVSNGGLKCCLNFLRDELFLEKNMNVRLYFFNVQLDLIEYICMNISSLSKSCDEDKRIWIELDTISLLLQVADKKESTRNPSYNSIINIADDKQLETLPEMSKIKTLFFQRLEMATNNFLLTTWKKEIRQYKIKGDTINCLILCITLQN